MANRPSAASAPSVPPPRNSQRAEFGDFQTPLRLARAVCAVVARTGFSPAAVIEPTCGRGAFLRAALEAFPNCRAVLALDRNAAHLEQAQAAVGHGAARGQVRLFQGDFFETDWDARIQGLPEPILVLGNPPWATNATLGALDSENLPAKTNHENLRGIDALTGRSNFDISEWMIRKNVEWLAARSGALAVLCKTAVARRVLADAWSRGLPIESAELRRIDAQGQFGAAVDAGLLLVRFGAAGRGQDCADYDSLEAGAPRAVFGWRDGTLVADAGLYERRRGLAGCGLSGWRSGIKHDCSSVFELSAAPDGHVNGLGAPAQLEPDLVFPLLKSSDLAQRRGPRKWLLVPHRSISGAADSLLAQAPNAQRYLAANRARLAARRSSIYRNRPWFSIFGVGEYTFAPWKVAISGLYKQLAFVEVPPHTGRPVVLDDTCYFFPCRSEDECRVLCELVRSTPAQEFWSSMIFWDAKRPITAGILNRLDLAATARAAGLESDLAEALGRRQRDG